MFKLLFDLDLFAYDLDIFADDGQTLPKRTIVFSYLLLERIFSFLKLNK